MGNSTYKDLFKSLGIDATEVPKLLRVLDQYFLDNDEWLSNRGNHTKWKPVLVEHLIASNEIANNKWFEKVLQLGEKLGVETAEIGLPALHSLHLLLKKKVDEKLGARAKSAKAAAAKKVPEDQEMAAPEAATPKAPAVHPPPDAADHTRVIAELDTKIAELGTKAALLEEKAGRMRLDEAKAELEVLAIKKRTAQKELELLAFKEKATKQELERIAVKEKEAKDELELIALRNKTAKYKQKAQALNKEAEKLRLAREKRLQEQAAAGGSGRAASSVASPAASTTADVKPAAPSAHVFPPKAAAVTTDRARATTPRR
ncbi:hypothetical protein FN846DRAFT_984827 [Sphaerosporella brunnea]|uniref:Uncharacterized protein n=1 Tax=Sphaerosporella brunnea TaxID=1250544 RepID=A0A5J5EUT8_9PEZI|nr:hypothetical protein FN846DRAFT_984827 [Sphaerosporella brunnea]